MKEEELLKKMMSNELTEDEFFEYLEGKVIEEGRFSKEEVRYALRLMREPEFCKKETGYNFHELYLIGEGFTPRTSKIY